MGKKNKLKRGSLASSTHFQPSINPASFQSMPGYGKYQPSKTYPNSNRHFSNPNSYGSFPNQSWVNSPDYSSYSNPSNRSFELANSQFPNFMEKNVSPNSNTASLLPTPPLLQNPYKYDRNSQYGVSPGVMKSSGNFSVPSLFDEASQWSLKSERNFGKNRADNTFGPRHINNFYDEESSIPFQQFESTQFRKPGLLESHKFENPQFGKPGLLGSPKFESPQYGKPGLLGSPQFESPRYSKPGLLGSHPKRADNIEPFHKGGILPIPNISHSNHTYGRDNFTDKGYSNNSMTSKKSYNVAQGATGHTLTGNYVKKPLLNSESTFYSQAYEKRFPTCTENFDDNLQTNELPPPQRMRNERNGHYGSFPIMQPNENHKRKRSFAQQEEDLFNEFDRPAKQYTDNPPADNKNSYQSSFENFSGNSNKLQERESGFNQVHQGMLDLVNLSNFEGGQYSQSQEKLSDSSYINQYGSEVLYSKPVGGNPETWSSYQKGNQSWEQNREELGYFTAGASKNFSKQFDQQRDDMQPSRAYQDSSGYSWNKLEKNKQNFSGDMENPVHRNYDTKYDNNYSGYQSNDSSGNRPKPNEFEAGNFTNTDEDDEDLRLHILRLKEKKIEEQLEELKKKSEETDRKLSMFQGSSSVI